MEQRLNPYATGHQGLKALFGLGGYLAKSKVEQPLLHLVYFRSSQINGCAFCLDMHTKDLRAMGETAQRLFTLDAWKHSSLYTARERAALAWTEAVTLIWNGGVPDEVYENARQHFSEEELIDLTVAVISVNNYNRLNIAFGLPAGNYQPGQFAAAN